VKRPRHTRRYRRRTIRVSVEYETLEGRQHATATTLGAGGMFIATESPHAASTLVVVRFRLEAGGTCHEIDGRVVWANQPGAAGARAPGMGVEFTDPAACAKLARELEGIGPPARPIAAAKRERGAS
jgi:uncharacterized protein (TIGR02266 family)